MTDTLSDRSLKDSSIRAAWESVQDRAQVSLEAFTVFSDGWTIYPVKVDGQIVGAIMVNGKHIHACIKPEGFNRWVSKKAVEILNEVIEKNGMAVTSMRCGNEQGKQFVERLGFRKKETVNGVQWYELRTKYGY